MLRSSLDWTSSFLRWFRPSKSRKVAATQRRLFSEPLEERRLLALTPLLLADINTTPDYAIGTNFTIVGNTAYFGAQGNGTGYELWKSDGTSSGTVLVADINPGASSAYPGNLTPVGNELYFTAYDPEHGVELWKTDGTSSGTVLVKDINPGTGDSRYNYGSSDSPLVNVNGRLFFLADDGVNGRELWSSDGTSSGTQLVSDINPGSNGQSFDDTNLINFNGTLFFNADDDANGIELWTSDGTSSGTTLYADINSSGGSLDNFPEFTIANDLLFFAADDGTNGEELYATDGSSSGAYLVADIHTSGDSQPSDLTEVNGQLFFNAFDGVNGVAIWISDGTSGGTQMVYDVSPSGSSYSFEPRYLTNINGFLAFAGHDGVHGYEPWLSSGTSSGTFLVADINPGSAGQYDSTYPVFLNGSVYFAANDGTNGAELWRSDGTSSGTVMVADLNPGGGGSYPYYLAVLNNHVIFVSDVFSGGELTASGALLSYDGVSASPELVSTIGTVNRGSSLNEVFNAGTYLLFSASDNFENQELYRTDGTTGGTQLVADINPLNQSGSNPRFLGKVNGGLVVFTANDGTNGRELWATDGTSSGTHLIIDLTAGSGGSYFSDGSSDGGVAEVDGVLYFSVSIDSNAHQIFRTDGTSSGTFLVSDLGTGGGGTYPGNFFNYNGTLLFSANDQINGNELWSSDGTSSGTVLLHDINPSTGGSYIQYFTELDGIAYFTATDGTNGNEIWRTNGTSSGTFIVADINPGSNGSYPQNLTVINNRLYFTANDDTHGRELWTSDGTSSGTQLVADIEVGADSGTNNSSEIVNLNGVIIFVADDGLLGNELWKTDGTSSGTELIADIYDPGSSNPRELTVAGDSVYFRVFTGVGESSDLWVSDGTSSGTMQVGDIFTGEYGSSPRDLTLMPNGGLFFTANDGDHGREPWVLTQPPLDVLGTPNDDVFVFNYISDTRIQVVVNGVSQEFAANAYPAVNFDTLDGNDTIYILNNYAAPDTTTFGPGTATIQGTNYILNVTNGESIVVYGDSSDTQTFTGTAGDDIYFGFPTASLMISGSFVTTTIGLGNSVVSDSLGNDAAVLIDSAGNDLFEGNETQSTFTDVPAPTLLPGQTFHHTINGYGSVYLFGGAGGNDVANFVGSARDDVAYGLSAFSILAIPVDPPTDPQTYVFFEAIGIKTVHLDASTGADVVVFFDSAEDDTFTARTTFSEMSSATYSVEASDFEAVYVFASLGGNDQIELDATNDVDDSLVILGDVATYNTTGLFLQMSSFESLEAFTQDENDTLLTVALDLVLSLDGDWIEL